MITIACSVALKGLILLWWEERKRRRENPGARTVEGVYYATRE